MDKKLKQIASHFKIESEIESIKPLGEGFINDTFKVKTIDFAASDYILQRKNINIFKNIPGMMVNIDKVTAHIKEKIVKAGGDKNREALTIINTTDNNLFYQDEEGQYWTVCLFIEDHLIFEKAETLELAYAGGKGIGKFQSMMADFKENLVDTLPGFHDIKFRFKQWDEALLKDAVNRKKELKKEIEWIESRRDEMLKFWQLIEEGVIPKRVTHNDTKLSNILFNENKDVLCVIDLDTVLSSTVLNDFGDAIRSYANTGKEDDANLKNVSMDIKIFEAYAAGYLSETIEFLTPAELDYLAFSAKFITYEQVLRFLVDYIDGDKYYRVKSPEHNLIRTHAQYKLLTSIEEQMDIMNATIQKLAGSIKPISGILLFS